MGNIRPKPVALVDNRAVVIHTVIVAAVVLLVALISIVGGYAA